MGEGGTSVEVPLPVAPSVDSTLDVNPFSFWLKPSIIAIILTSKEASSARFIVARVLLGATGFVVVLLRYYAEYLLGSSTVDPSADKDVRAPSEDG